MAERRPGRRVQARERIRLMGRWVRESAANAREVARPGPPYHAPFSILDQDRMFRLRRYAPVDDSSAAATIPPVSAPLILIPPLMLTAQIYDVSPELSAVALLARQGVDTWVIDFGAPEREAGGMTRTLDDHVRAVSRAVDRVHSLTGRDVHLAGYSQGGMFAYQTAAYRRSQGIASVITFGSPVDIHQSVPKISSDVVGLFAHAIRPVLVRAAEHIEGLPGVLTAAGFKLLTPRKEIEQFFDFLKNLHDRKALEKRAVRRRFLGGEGFVAWPGPALRTFLDEFIVHNRMLSGGMVIDGRTVTLADIACPVLAFVGTRDTFARPAAARAIAAAAPRAEVHVAEIATGHFGLVVGSRAMNDTWPTLVDWVRHRDAGTGLPPRLAAPPPPSHEDEPEEAAFDVKVEVDLAFDFLRDFFEGLLRRGSDAVRDAGESAFALRYQVPKLTQLERMTDDTLVGPSRALADRARAIPERTFFLWNGRAFSYADADARVNHVVRGFAACGVRAGHKVVVSMAGRPSFLSAVTALARLGAVPVVLPPGASQGELGSALKAAGATHMVADPERAEEARIAFGRDVLVLGGGGGARALAPGLVDMEAIDPAAVVMPEGHQDDPGRARDLGAIIAMRGAGDGLRLAPITNHRWALSAIGAAAACTLRPDDTVYSCLPLHHPAGLLVSVGAALASGARLALAAEFDAATFWPEVRRYGATVVFYAGEMMRPLADAPPTKHDLHHPVRLFAGSGMRPDLWQRLVERFGVGVLEFYASTTQNLVLANASGAKIGALGRPLPGSTALEVVRFDLSTLAPLRDAHGRLVRAEPDQPGLGVTPLSGEPLPGQEGRVLADAFSLGDRWFASRDLLRRDVDGDVWFVDRASGMVATSAGFVSTRRIEDALYRMPEVHLAACWGEGDRVIATVVGAPLDPVRLGAALAEALTAAERPRVVFRLSSLPITDGYQPNKHALRDAAASDVLETLRYDQASERYVSG